MQSKVQISKWQFAMMTLGFLIGTSTLVTSGTVADHDGWMSQIIAGGLGILASSIWLKLGNQYPGKLPGEYFKIIVGPYIGTLVTLLYIWFCFHLGTLVITNVKYAYLSTVFVETPGVVFVISMVSLTGYAIYIGLEGFARSTEIITPSVVFFLMLITLFTFLTPGLIRYDSLLPMFEKGWIPVFKGAFSVFAFPFGETIVLLSILPFVSQQQRCSKYLFTVIAVTSGLLALVAIRNITVLGVSGVKQAVFPSLLSVQLIDIGNFIQRLDSAILFVWTFGSFIKITVCMYAVVLNLGSLFKLPDPSVLVFPIGSFTVSFSKIIFKNIVEMLDFAEFVWPFYTLPFQVIMPLTLLGISMLHKNANKQRRTPS